MDEGDEMLTVAQVAQELGYSRKHIYAMIERGHLEARRDPYQLRGSTRIPRSSVEEVKRRRKAAH